MYGVLQWPQIIPIFLSCNKMHVLLIGRNWWSRNQSLLDWRPVHGFTNCRSMKCKEQAMPNWQHAAFRDCHGPHTRFYRSWSHKISQTRTESNVSWTWRSADVALHLICNIIATGEACKLSNCCKLSCSKKKAFCVCVYPSDVVQVDDFLYGHSNLSNGSGVCLDPEGTNRWAEGVLPVP